MKKPSKNGAKSSDSISLNMDEYMTCIVANQKTYDAVTSGTAFRFAYNRAKTWKAWIWGITFVFAVLQTGTSAFAFSNGTPTIDPTPFVVSFLLASVIAGSFGKQKVEKWQNTGCLLQRLHDFAVMNVGIKPTHIELPKAKVIALSKKRLIKVPEDRNILQTWWSESLAIVPFPVAKVIAAYSTFSWESALRKQYQTLLILLLTASIAIPLLLALFLDYTISQTIIFTFAPFTPFISVVLDELLSNKKSLIIAEALTIECHSTWANVVAGKLTDSEIENTTELHMNSWQSFRQSATPIFEWLYNQSRNNMEMSMIINTGALVDEFNSKK
ncbi:TPA: S-4TM family putative pore-forming effector [Vibrio parahaemolyticus]